MSDDDRPTIEERENGPFVAKNVTSMMDRDGKPVAVKPLMVLCRCGHSANKPFCDGSHKRVGFRSRGGEPAGRDRLLTYKGTEVSVTFNPRLCSHAAECGRLARHVFDAGRRPWIEPDNGTVAEVEAVIAACPSGALALVTPDGEPKHKVRPRAQITVQKNGPYWVQGVAPPEAPMAVGQTREKYVLCRCGLSGNKPWCDGAHRDLRWKDGA